MKRIILLIFACVALSASAQDSLGVATAPQALKFGYLSYEEALHAMPEYAIVQQNLKALRQQYDAEATRVENDFNKKYEEFLDGMKEFPQTILQKRQRELQDLMQSNIAFKEESRRELKKAETDALAPLKARLADVLAAIGRERGYALIINTDANACPFIDPAMGEDIQEEARMKLTIDN